MTKEFYTDTKIDRYVSLKYKEPKMSPGEKQKRETKRIHQIWVSTVRNYSTRSLSFQSDKLIAISGAAREMQRLLDGDEYIAGIWKSNLLQGLVWTTGKSREHIEDSQTPSWSWACMNSIIKFSPNLEDIESVWDFKHAEDTFLDRPDSIPENLLTEAEIVDVQTSLLDPTNPFGLVSGGILTLSSHWCKIKLEATQNADTYEKGNNKQYTLWTKKLFPGFDISHGEFTLAFTDENSNPTYTIDEDGSLIFPIITRRSPHDSNMFTGDAMKISLDEHLKSEDLEFTSSWLIYELQHIFGPFFLMVKAIEGEDAKYRRVGLAEVIQL